MGLGTNPPLKAPTGFRSGMAADGVSSSCDDVRKGLLSRIGCGACRANVRSTVGNIREAMVMYRQVLGCFSGVVMVRRYREQR